MVTGFLHPGAMGASLAACCAGDRLWVGAGRSSATRNRAATAGLVEVNSLDELAEQADVIMSVCPPASALAVADRVQATGYDGIYVDANAVAPATARAIGTRFDRFVDGAVIGPPVHEAGSTRLYVAGDDTDAIVELWRGSALEVRVVAGGAGAASALKMCFAGWTKGSAALLLATRALAHAEGVEDALLAEWAVSMPDLAEQSERVAAHNTPKAWRFAGELREIASASAAHGLPDGFGRAAAEVYDALASLRDAPDVTLAAVLEALLAPE